MDIVRSFNSNSLNINIQIKGTTDFPLFRASDIGDILEISNIRQNLKELNETEKTVIEMQTLSGIKPINFLTEKGLYKILFKSKKKIASIFQDWVCDVIKELHLKGNYELTQQLEINNKEKNKLEYEKKNLEFTNKNLSALEKQK